MKFYDISPQHWGDVGGRRGFPMSTSIGIWNKRIGALSQSSVHDMSSWDLYAIRIKKVDSRFSFSQNNSRRISSWRKEKDPEIHSNNTNFVDITSVSSFTYFLFLIALHIYKGHGKPTTNFSCQVRMINNHPLVKLELQGRQYTKQATSGSDSKTPALPRRNEKHRH